MERHDIAGHLKLFKELYQKEKKTKESGKKFGEMESNYKKQVEHLLVDEFSYALNETSGAVERAAVSGDGVKPETTGNPQKKLEQNH